MKITYEIEIEPEEMPVRGNVMCSGDDAQDRADEDEVLARLAKGEVEAWCTVKVTARVDEFEHTEYLGACSFDSGYTAEMCAEEHGMKEMAKAALRAMINDLNGKTTYVLREWDHD